MKKIIIALLIVTMFLASFSALAGGWRVVATDGDSYIRVGPGLDYPTITVLQRGYYVYATGYFTTDSRGVAWYEVYTDYGTAWISSMYTDLRDW